MYINDNEIMTTAVSLLKGEYVINLDGYQLFPKKINRNNSTVEVKVTLEDDLVEDEHYPKYDSRDLENVRDICEALNKKYYIDYSLTLKSIKGYEELYIKLKIGSLRPSTEDRDENE